MSDRLAKIFKQWQEEKEERALTEEEIELLLSDDEDETDGRLGAVPEEHQGGSMTESPQFEPVTNGDLQCADCRFRIPDGGILRCHKYDMKPAEVINGGECPKYKPE